MTKYFNLWYVKKDEKKDETRWTKVGVVTIDKNNRPNVKINVIPIGDPDWNGWLYAYPPKDYDHGGKNKNNNDDDDDIF